MGNYANRNKGTINKEIFYSNNDRYIGKKKKKTLHFN